MSDIKETLGKNITALRMKNGMTQSELAEKLNYTDKSISKWEHGDSTPPIEVLKELADLFGVTVDYLISDESNESYDKIYTGKNNITNKIIITCLAVLVVWLLAMIAFIYSSFLKTRNPWLYFVDAVPLSFIVLIVFNSIWGKRKYLFALISLLIWTLLTTVFIYLLEQNIKNIWTLFLLGIPIQIATILWSQLKPKKRK